MAQEQPEWQRRLASATEPEMVAAREAVARGLSAAFRAAGQILWVSGYIMGADRVTGRSPFGFGNDRVVGLSVVAQDAGELCAGAVTLLEHGNVYAAVALLRQLVEVEYLAWAFAEDDEEAATWLRSSKEERQTFWQPRHLRKRSGGRFRGEDYAMHCEIGGHPTPSSRRILPDHETLPTVLWWIDLTGHGVGAWEHLQRAAAKLGHVIGGMLEAKALDEAIVAWRRRKGQESGRFTGMIETDE